MAALLTHTKEHLGFTHPALFFFASQVAKDVLYAAGNESRLYKTVTLMPINNPRSGLLKFCCR